jgi:hypothetical protein
VLPRPKSTLLKGENSLHGIRYGGCEMEHLVPRPGTQKTEPSPAMKIAPDDGPAEM